MPLLHFLLTSVNVNYLSYIKNKNNNFKEEYKIWIIKESILMMLKDYEKYDKK